MTMTLTFVGNVLEQPLEIQIEEANHTLLTEYWRISRDVAEIILNGWRDAPREDDVIRHWELHNENVYVLVLVMEGGVSIDYWPVGTLVELSKMPLEFDDTFITIRR